MRLHRHIAEAGAEQTGGARSRRPPHKTAETTPAAPVVLPHIVMTVHDDGTMTVTVDGQPYEADPFAPPWQRDSFALILDQLTDQHRSPVRVEVREADGIVFTDLIAPGKRHRPDTETEPGAPDPAVPTQPVLHGKGFVPGEDVAVAVVVAHGEAAPDGTMRGPVEADQLAASATGEVILLGRVSGTVVVGHPE